MISRRGKIMLVLIIMSIILITMSVIISNKTMKSYERNVNCYDKEGSKILGLKCVDEYDCDFMGKLFSPNHCSDKYLKREKGETK